jgi:hypothetical protein
VAIAVPLGTDPGPSAASARLRIRISQGGHAGPPPPLAGALAAWVLRAAGDVRIVDPRTGTGDPLGAPSGPLDPSLDTAPLWVHLEGGFGPERIAQVRRLLLPSDADDREGIASGVGLVGFGPGVDGPGAASLLAAFPGARVVAGDPERGLPGAPDRLEVSALPLTTFAGFGAEGGLFRLLAGRGGRGRPVAAVVREIVYLVETAQLGHVLFDDADLAAWPGWLDAFEAELAHLPWTVTWEGTAAGRRIQCRLR